MIPAGASLRRRLLVGAALWIAAALLISGVLIAWLLTRAVETQVYDRLEIEVDRLVAALEVAPDGRVTIEPLPADPAFEQPYSGSYWQISTAGLADASIPLARSRSLWDDVLELPEGPPLDGQLHRHGGLGPGGAPVILVERAVFPSSIETRLRVVVAVESAAVSGVTRPAIVTLAVSLVVLAAGLIVAAWLQVAAGLKPLERLRRAVVRIAVGEASLLGTGWPQEVAPLAAELDLVLTSNRRMAETGRRQAADMAHALKTRLAAAANEADDLARLDGAAAGRLTEELAAARRLLDRHLARARSGAVAPGLRSRVPAAEVIDKLASVVLRLSGRNLAVSRDLDPAAIFLGDRVDLEEIAGNLFDNAAKWAKGRIRFELRRAEAGIRLTVEDDGPGIPERDRARVLQPGARLDEQTPGTGLGLAIVRDLAITYGGDLELADSNLGGLSARVTLPSG